MKSKLIVGILLCLCLTACISNKPGVAIPPGSCTTSDNIDIDSNEQITIQLHTDQWQQGNIKVVNTQDADCLIVETDRHDSDETWDIIINIVPQNQSGEDTYRVVLSNQSSQAMHASINYLIGQKGEV
ncbi:MAG: hypothetical protein ABSF21_00150 [Dehalococcoidia bacterium]|jgi:hypothetical protein